MPATCFQRHAFERTDKIFKKLNNKLELLTKNPPEIYDIKI